MTKIVVRICRTAEGWSTHHLDVSQAALDELQTKDGRTCRVAYLRQASGVKLPFGHTLIWQPVADLSEIGAAA